MNEHGTVVSAGIDYCTATGSSESEQAAIRGIGFESLDAARAGGNIIRPWRWSGYEGWTGGGVSLGSRHGGAIVRLSSDRAAGMGRKLLNSGANITRLDLQTTVRFNRDIPGLADQHADEVIRHQQGGGLKPALRHQRAFGRGDTLYVGSRQSNYYGRVYDKYRESGDARYTNCWRYEVECKGDGAKAASKALDGRTEVEAAASAIVHRWFMDRGCSVRYRPTVACDVPPIGASHSDLDSWLGWLLTQVRPGVQRFLPYVSRETIEDILFGPDVLEQAGYRRDDQRPSGPPIVAPPDQE